MSLNNLLAAPGFSAWMEGEPLDVAAAALTPEGKPRVSILSIAHLERRRADVLRLAAAQPGARRGCASSRARPACARIVYMDEIAGYLPPVANPPSKAADADAAQAGARVRRRHRAGDAEPGGPRLQGARRTPARGSSAGCRPSATRRACCDWPRRARCRPPAARSIATSHRGKIIAGLGKRQFLLHATCTRIIRRCSKAGGDELGPCGPLTRAQIKILMDGRREAGN